MRLLWELSKYEYYQISSEVRAMQSIIHKISLPSPHPENFPPPPPPPPVNLTTSFTNFPPSGPSPIISQLLQKKIQSPKYDNTSIYVTTGRYIDGNFRIISRI